jgi:hypothetical protein
MQLQLAMIFRAQQVVDLLGVNRRFDELEDHRQRIPQWRSPSMAEPSLFFLAQRQGVAPATGGAPPHQENGF